MTTAASGHRLFIDTAYFIARANPQDNLHDRAEALSSVVQTADKVFVTDAVLTEVGNSLRKTARARAVAALLIQGCFDTPNLHVVVVDRQLFDRSVQLYRARPDKTWSLTDCISMTVMEDESVTMAVTSDHHFEQAGYTALLRGVT